MIVTIHQPESLPWLGYFSKMASADMYILLTDCTFRKNYYQNRNRIVRNNKLEYVTVPVESSGLSTKLIRDVQIADNWRGHMLNKCLNTIRGAYRGAPNYNITMPVLEYEFNKSYTIICQLNRAIIYRFREWLGITTPIVDSVVYNVGSTSSHRVADLVRAAGGDIYLSGPSGRDYLDMNDFDGIDVMYHDYVHPKYSQFNSDEFIPYASTLDLLMNYSPGEARDIIMSGYNGGGQLCGNQQS